MENDSHTEHNNREYLISIPIADANQTLANSIAANLPTDSPSSPSCCIFRVPEVLRRKDDQNVFEPYTVAIGPFHCKKKSLEPMENVKKWYLQTLLSRTSISVASLIEGIKEFETQARESYQGPLDVYVGKNEFLEMMVIDGCFLIEFFRKLENPNLISPNDPLFHRPCMSLYHDLLLLENQLPWFILDILYNLTMPNDQINQPLVLVVLKFFKPYFPMFSTSKLGQFCCLHIVHLIREVLVCPYHDTAKGHSPYFHKPIHIPCVTRLLEAGLKFEKSSSDSILNITFENGTFIIPTFLFNESSEPMFWNLIAFEQCYPNCLDMITSYAFLMNNLINTDEDVKHLQKKGIIHHWLSAKDTSAFFNRLYINTLVSSFYCDKLCEIVNHYYQWELIRRRLNLALDNRWRATLVRDYCKTPWTVISVVAACIFFVLTFLQTVYTIK